MIKAVFCILIFATLASCTSDYWEEYRLMDRSRSDTYNSLDIGSSQYRPTGILYALSDHRLIDPYGDNAFTMKPKAEVALVLPGETQHINDLTVNLPKGSNLSITKRGSRYEKIDDAIEYIFSKNGLKVISAGKVVSENAEYNTDTDQYLRIRMIEDGSISTLVIDTDTISQLINFTLATDNTILEFDSPGTELSVTGIELLPLRNSRREEYISRPSEIRPNW